jgi:zinc protease
MKRLFLGTLLLIWAVVALAQMPQKVTSIEGVTEWHLPNGLKVLTIPDPGADTITIHIVYLVGSRHEGYGEKGMAHLLEHMLFKGSKNFPDVKADRRRRTSTGRSRWRPTAWSIRASRKRTSTAR